MLALGPEERKSGLMTVQCFGGMCLLQETCKELIRLRRSSLTLEGQIESSAPIAEVLCAREHTLL